MTPLPRTSNMAGTRPGPRSTDPVLSFGSGSALLVSFFFFSGSGSGSGFELLDPDLDPASFLLKTLVLSANTGNLSTFGSGSGLSLNFRVRIRLDFRIRVGFELSDPGRVSFFNWTRILGRGPNLPVPGSVWTSGPGSGSGSGLSFWSSAKCHFCLSGTTSFMGVP